MLEQISAVLGGTSHKVGYPAVGEERQERSWGARYGIHFEELVDEMLVVDPRSRISAKAAVEHVLASNVLM